MQSSEDSSVKSESKISAGGLKLNASIIRCAQQSELLLI